MFAPAFLLLFMVLAGGGLALLLGIAVIGLGRSWTERARAQAFAKGQGWCYDGPWQFSGRFDGGEWRGGPDQDSESGRRWTLFHARMRWCGEGGFAWLPASMRPEDTRWSPEPGSQQPPLVFETGNEWVRERWTMVGTHPHWARLWTPEVARLWVSWQAMPATEISVVGDGWELTLRVEGASLCDEIQLERLFRLGLALVAAMQTGRPRTLG